MHCFLSKGAPLRFIFSQRAAGQGEQSADGGRVILSYGKVEGHARWAAQGEGWQESVQFPTFAPTLHGR
jgi:hypothetical protein